MTDSDTTDRDVSRAIRSWLNVDRHEDASRIAGAVLDHVEATPRRRATRWPAWRTPNMNRFAMVGLGAAAVVAAILIGAQLLGGPSDGSGLGGPTSPTPEPSPTPGASAAEPSASQDAFLPDGPILVYDPVPEGAPSVTMTIRATGWTYNADFSALAKGDELDNLPEAAFLPESVPAGSGYYVYGDPCRWESTSPEAPATTVDEVVAALAAQASRDPSEPVDVTVGSYAGKHITLHVPDDMNAASCEGGEWAMYGVEPDSFARYNQGPGQVDDLWVIDVDGAIVIIDAMSRPDTPDALIAEMRTMAESATFDAP
jgi:hypothetical protein